MIFKKSVESQIQVTPITHEPQPSSVIFNEKGLISTTQCYCIHKASVWFQSVVSDNGVIMKYNTAGTTNASGYQWQIQGGALAANSPSFKQSKKSVF